MVGSVWLRSFELWVLCIDELVVLLVIEQCVGELFRGYEVYLVFVGYGLDLLMLQEGCECGQFWVVDGVGGGIVGYLLVGDLVGEFYVLQMDVDLVYVCCGYGCVLLWYVLVQVRVIGFVVVVLIILSDVLWMQFFMLVKDLLKYWRWSGMMVCVLLLLKRLCLGF